MLLSALGRIGAVAKTLSGGKGGQGPNWWAMLGAFVLQSSSPLSSASMPSDSGHRASFNAADQSSMMSRVNPIRANPPTPSFRS